MTIKIVYDNRKENQAMQEGWGFSCVIELGQRKVLFDTGADKTIFFSNLQKLCISPESITDVVFSHKHSDHTAGFLEVLQNVKKGARLFLPKGFPAHELPPHIQATIVNKFAEIDLQIYSFVLKGGFFLYEQALALQTSKGLVVITGCAHPGVTHLLEVVKKRLNSPIYLVLGGFHLFRKSRKFITKIMDMFEVLGVEKVAPCHCSGDVAIAQFQEVYQDRFCNIGTGTILTFT